MVGCDDGGQRDPEAILARAKNLVPADPVLEEIYLRSCVSCHAVADTIAPLTGDTESWRPRQGPYTTESMFQEPFVLFSYHAGLTKTIELVTAVMVRPQRQTNRIGAEPIIFMDLKL